MGKQAPTNSQRKPLVLFLFHSLLFSYPLLSLLWRRSYPILKAEVGLLLLLFIIFAILLALILNKARTAFSNVLSTLSRQVSHITGNYYAVARLLTN